MLQPDAEAQLLGQYALVSYVPGPLARFLDDLRLELTPGCNPHAHVTVLPPRRLNSEPADIVRDLKKCVLVQYPFQVELGSIEIFPGSNVVYMELDRGGKDLRRMYETLNCGRLAYAETFPYHPHLTLAQHLTLEQATALADTARARWEDWTGPHGFEVESVSLVRNVSPRCWLDIAKMPLSAAVPVSS